MHSGCNRTTKFCFTHPKKQKKTTTRTFWVRDIIFAQMEFSRSLVRSFSSWATISKSSQKEENLVYMCSSIGFDFHDLCKR